MKINKENELKIKSLNKSERNLSINLHVSEKRLEFEKNKVILVNFILLFKLYLFI